MRLKSIYCLLLVSAAFVSCNDMLDTLPDNRTQLDSEEKIKSLMTSAYPEGSPAIIAELSGDNFIDNGKFLGSSERQHDEIFAWEPSTAALNQQDSPGFYWNSCYKAIATANHALRAIEEMGNPANLQGLKAEALLCRAYGHFQLANIFCMAYDPKTADTYLGIPYATVPETIVSPVYERGTLKQTYENIANDIDSAFQIGVIDGIHEIAKYHFGVKSANAFAARFYLYYGNYEKVIEHANVVLGNNPSAMLRDFSQLEMSEYEYVGNWYIKASNACNLLIVPVNSAFARVYGTRYGHAGIASAGCLQGPGPNWTDKPTFVDGYTYYIRNIQYGIIYPKQIEFFEYTDKIAKTGFVHIVHTAFTADETLLCRAEAYVHLNRLEDARIDLEIWTKSHKIGSPLTDARIKSFYVEGNTYFVNKLNADMPTIVNDNQKTYLQCVLHFRRIETVYEGLRWNDLKRYGIDVTHVFDNKVSETLKYNDPRRAIQIPADVASVGLESNPRKTSSEGNPSSNVVLIK